MFNGIAGHLHSLVLKIWRAFSLIWQGSRMAQLSVIVTFLMLHLHSYAEDGFMSRVLYLQV